MERLELARILGAEMATGEVRRDVVVEEREPARFMARFAAAVASGGRVFVVDPAWAAAERAQWTALRESASGVGGEREGHGWLCLPTGGSSGRMRLARHDQDTLSAAVRGCSDHFGVSRIHAVGVLPLHHVSGLMAWMRCGLTGGRYVPWSWPELEAGRWPELGPGDWFLSLVPTQLQRLLGRPEAEEHLRRFRAVFLGGGPAWPDLLTRAAEARLPLSPGYGMTETAAMVATLRPEEFLAGWSGAGRALPHARLSLDDDGVIRIEAGSLFRGYYPHWRDDGPWTTDDLGLFDEHGSLRVLGRRDALIITGGEKVDPGEVEAVLRSTGQFGDVTVIGLPDAEWGQRVVACYAAGAGMPDLEAVAEQVADRLAPAKRPKRYVALQNWPRSAQGKVNRRRLAELAQAALERAGG